MRQVCSGDGPHSGHRRVGSTCGQGAGGCGGRGLYPDPLLGCQLRASLAAGSFAHSLHGCPTRPRLCRCCLTRAWMRAKSSSSGELRLLLASKLVWGRSASPVCQRVHGLSTDKVNCPAGPCSWPAVNTRPLSVCSLIAAPEGIHVLCKKFPRLKVRCLRGICLLCGQCARQCVRQCVRQCWTVKGGQPGHRFALLTHY